MLIKTNKNKIKAEFNIMKIIQIENENLKEHYFQIENKYALHLTLYPMPDFSSTIAIFATNFGSINNTFKFSPEQTTRNVPAGTAHYLEHKLFENKNNSTFNLFAKTGASTNAFTSFDLTAFFFLCTYNFDASLKILLDFVQNPHFTPENVQKERSIIEQEIQMYEDDPENKLIMNCLKALYHKHPVRLDVGGSTSSIKNIDVNTLMDCYNAFYKLNNMGLVIAGNFDFDNTLKIIETNLKKPQNLNTTQTILPDEPMNVASPLIEAKMPVLVNYFCFGYKLNPCTSPTQLLEQKMMFEFICELLTSQGSSLFSTLLEQSLVTGGLIDYEVMAGQGYLTILFSGQSNNYKKVFELLNEEIKKVQTNGFENELFNLVKKQFYYDQIMNFNSVKSVAQLLLHTFSYKCSAFQPTKFSSSLTIEELNKQVKNINLNNCSISIVSPNTSN